MKGTVKMLQIYLDDTDLWHGQPLYESIVRRLRQAGILRNVQPNRSMEGKSVIPSATKQPS